MIQIIYVITSIISDKDILIILFGVNGIPCESVDEDSGECATGEAFATCAGFLAFAINQTSNA